MQQGWFFERKTQNGWCTPVGHVWGHRGRGPEGRIPKKSSSDAFADCLEGGLGGVVWPLPKAQAPAQPDLLKPSPAVGPPQLWECVRFRLAGGGRRGGRQKEICVGRKWESEGAWGQSTRMKTKSGGVWHSQTGNMENIIWERLLVLNSLLVSLRSPFRSILRSFIRSFTLSFLCSFARELLDRKIHTQRQAETHTWTDRRTDIHSQEQRQTQTDFRTQWVHMRHQAAPISKPLTWHMMEI